MTRSRADQMALLVDRQEIVEAICRYCRGVDRNLEALLQSVYHDDAVEDRGSGPRLFKGRARDFVPLLLAMVNRHYTATQHFVGNCLIDLDGNRACVETYFHAHHRLKETNPPAGARQMILAGRYLDKFEKRDEVWKISYRRMIADWSHEGPISENWLEINPGLHRGTREETDFHP